jgi:hypothetical protein
MGSKQTHKHERQLPLPSLSPVLDQPSDDALHPMTLPSLTPAYIHAVLYGPKRTRDDLPRLSLDSRFPLLPRLYAFRRREPRHSSLVRVRRGCVRRVGSREGCREEMMRGRVAGKNACGRGGMLLGLAACGWREEG